MRADLPDTLPDFRLPPRDDYNAGVTEERPLSPVRMAYEITELAKLVGTIKLAASLTQSVLTLQEDINELAERVDQLSLGVTKKIELIDGNGAKHVIEFDNARLVGWTVST